MAKESRRQGGSPTRTRRRSFLRAGIGFAALFLLSFIVVLWLGSKASTIKNELEATAQLVPVLKEDIAGNRATDAAGTVNQMKKHTESARSAAQDPVWTLASVVPFVGANFDAVAEVARTADDVTNLGIGPLVRVYESLKWESLLPSSAGADLKPLQDSAPSVAASAHAIELSSARLAKIDTESLLPQVASPIEEVRLELASIQGALNAAASAAQLAPAMLGVDEPRTYLLMVQNNAEIRASGGIPGALAVLNVERGILTMGTQLSAVDVGVAAPPIATDTEQQQIYSGRLGKFMQDVNLTPNFPTAASTAQAMWERRTGNKVDGVISIDPVALSFILEATGPVQLSDPELLETANAGLPTKLSAENVVQTLLSDVYARIDEPELQDSYFAGVAQQVFSALSNGQSDAKRLVAAITRGVEERRVLIWSASSDEQGILAKYVLSGSTAGSSVSPAQFGVYFNDGTGAKMDYYVKRTVQLIKECPLDGYEQTTVRVTSTNTAPTDAATSLPAYVTGGGNFGVPPGSVQTNIVAYGPVQANVETAKLDGQKTEFAPYFHANRPVGVLAIRLAPGESRTIDFTFGKIVQHTEPNVAVTPTVQDVKDVTLPTETVACG
jgi:hypothetical protein